jgi:hypothetical protein
MKFIILSRYVLMEVDVIMELPGLFLPFKMTFEEKVKKGAVNYTFHLMPIINLLS